MWLRQFGACPWSIVCRPYVVYRQHLKRPVFAVWISTRNSRTDQKLSKWLRRQQLNWRHEVQSETQQCVKWLETLGEHVSVVDANAGVFMHWRSFVFVVSLFLLSVSVVVLWLFSLIDARTLWLKFESSFTPSSSSCFIRTVSDLFDLSIHFISFLFISLIYLHFLLLSTFYFLKVVDNKPAHYRWGGSLAKKNSTCCLSEEGEKFKQFLVNHQIDKTHTIIETVQARLQVLTNVATEFNGVSLWQNWQTEYWKHLSLLEPPKGSLLRTCVHVLSDSPLCVGGHNATANEAWATKTSEVQDPMTFIDKYDITGRLVQCHKHQISGQTAIQITREIQTFLWSTRSFSCRCWTTLNGRQKTVSKDVMQTQQM